MRATGYDLSVVAERPCSYDMTMQYNNMSSPVQFTQMIATETATTSVNNTYHYDASVQPNAPLQIGDTYYTYDAAGNPTSILNSEGKGKDLRWDAENRIRSISDSQEGLHHAYAYDHTGERILKRYGSAQQSSYNGKDVGTLFDFGESYSAYVSPYFVETNNGYTKHYYAGATRLVSKIGEGVYQDSAYVSYGDEEKDQYFYFQDHLGSSTYITTLNGEVAQYAAYTPYGELFREYRNVTPYKFNGKELDAETGLYYYGARYYNPATALWLGVDPLASKYPSVSPYVYCVGNPVKYVDPDGAFVLAFKGSGGAGAGIAWGFSAKGEVGTVFDKYGVTSYVSSTVNHVNNQEIKESSKNAQMFIGLYAGISAGAELDWKNNSFKEYKNNFTTSLPIANFSLTVGDNSVGVSGGIGAYFAFETSPSSWGASLSISYKEYLTYKPESWTVTFNPDTEQIGDDITSYRGIATLYDSMGKEIIQLPVQCGITDYETKNPTLIWETEAYKQNQQNE